MTVQITAALIKELRDRTGVGMSKCKEALTDASGDIELAIANLRKAGIASAAKKEGRSTNEGMIGVGESEQAFAIVEVNAETDFVVKNQRFQQFVAEIADEVAKVQPQTLDQLLSHSFGKDGDRSTVEEVRAALVQAIGENIQIRRLMVLPKGNDKSIGVYSHLGGKIVTAVQITGRSGEEALAKEIAMHVAAASPEYLSPEEVPANIIATERDIAHSQVKGKPENIVEKIIDGKINAFYDSSCLSRQKFIKNDALSVSQVVDSRSKEIGASLKLSTFLRWGVGQA